MGTLKYFKAVNYIGLIMHISVSTRINWFIFRLQLGT